MLRGIIHTTRYMLFMIIHEVCECIVMSQANVKVQQLQTLLNYDVS